MTPGSLRERKKARTRRALADTAVRLFLANGFDATTLDQVVDAVEVSKRTFFRMYPSKEAVAIAPETELWDSYVAHLSARAMDGTVLAALRDGLTDTISAMDDDWPDRFIATRGLAARTPAVWNFSDLTSITVQLRLVGVLEAKLGIDSATDVRLRLLGEITMSAWRCGARNWIRTNLRIDHRVARTDLVDRVREAFDAIPDSIALHNKTASR